MTISLSVPVFFMVIGAILMHLAGPGKIADIGRMLFQAGAFAFAFNAGHLLK